MCENVESRKFKPQTFPVHKTGCSYSKAKINIICDLHALYKVLGYYIRTAIKFFLRLWVDTAYSIQHVIDWLDGGGGVNRSKFKTWLSPCVVFVDKTLLSLSHSASLHPGV